MKPRALRMTGLAKTKMVGKEPKPVAAKVAHKPAAKSHHPKSKKSPAPGA